MTTASLYHGFTMRFNAKGVEMTREIASIIRANEAGRALQDFLADRFTYHTADEWMCRIAEGRVRVNGHTATPDRILSVGDHLRYDASDIPEPPVDCIFRILIDDPLLLVIDKPGNLPCHPGGRYFRHTLWALLQTQCGLAHPVFVNRIDRETSGLVLIAKTPEAGRNLARQFSGGRVTKTYTVLVEGMFPERVEARGWLHPDPDSAVRKKRRFSPAPAGSAAPGDAAEWSETVFERERVCDGFSVVTARPRTGRLHQIRATLLSLGFPVVGDKLYGVDEQCFLRFCSGGLTERDRARLRMGRQALHAVRLAFRHPHFGTPTDVDAPLPSDMEALIGGHAQACL